MRLLAACVSAGILCTLCLSSLATADSPEGNLAIPDDLEPRKRKSLEDAIALWESYVYAGSAAPETLDKAVLKLESCSKYVTESALPLYYLGMALAQQGNEHRALATLRRAITKQPDFWEVHVEMGGIHMARNDSKEAIESFEEALEIHSECVDALLGRAAVRVSGAEYTLAADDLKRARELLHPQVETEIEAYEQAERAAEETPVEPGQQPRLLPLPSKELQMYRSILSMELRVATEVDGPGWPQVHVHESSNYIVHTSHSEEYSKSIADHAEIILGVYKKVFPAVKRPDRKYAIWIYPDRARYVAAGNPKQAAGHYDIAFRKLVLFRQRTDAETAVILSHEAFHQFLHDYTTRAPQWFNEGLGDYFGGFVETRTRGGRRVAVARPNPFRLADARAVVTRGPSIPTPILMQMTKRQMYEPSIAGAAYAQSWAIVYYVLEGDGPRDYRKAFQAYFKAVQRGDDLRESYESTFGRLDMGEFERRWREFIRELR